MGKLSLGVIGLGVVSLLLLSSGTARADEDKGKDSGPGQKWIWANVETGVAYTDMKAFSQSNLAVTDSSSSGALVGFGGGVRLLFLDVGFRARNNTSMNIWDLDGEVRFHMKMGGLDPSLALRGGYSTVGTLNQSVNSATGNAQVDVHGWNVGTGFALDFVIAGFLTLGAEVSGQVLFLTRPIPPDPPGFNMLPSGVQQQIKQQPLYQNQGDSVGFGGALGVRAGVQF